MFGNLILKKRSFGDTVAFRRTFGRPGGARTRDSGLCEKGREESRGLPSPPWLLDGILQNARNLGIGNSEVALRYGGRSVIKSFREYGEFNMENRSLNISECFP